MMSHVPISQLAACVALCVLASTTGWAQSGGEKVHLSLQRYAAMLEATKQAATGQASLGLADVRVALPDASSAPIEVEVSGDVTRIGDKPALFALLPADVAVSHVTVAGVPAGLVRVGGFHAVYLGGDSQTSKITLKYAVSAHRGGGGNEVVIPIPAASSAKMHVRGKEADSVVATPSLHTLARNGQTVVTLPGVRAVVLRWGSTSQRTVVRSARYEVRPVGSGEGARVDATFSVLAPPNAVRIKVARREVALVSAQLDGQAAATVSEDGWHVVLVSGAGNHRIDVQLRVPIDRSGGQPQIQLGLTSVPITQVVATVPGKRSVHFDPPVPVDASITKIGGKVHTKAIGHLPPQDKVVLRWTESRAAPEQLVRFNSETTQLVTLAEGVLRSRVVVSYEVIRGKLSSLPVQIPDDVVVYKVSGSGIEDWRTYAGQKGAARQVRIALAGGVTGKQRLEILLERRVGGVEGAKIEIPVVRPLGAHREMGVIALFEGDRVGFAKVSAPTGYSVVGQDAVPAEIRRGLKTKVTQGFRHIGPPARLSSAVATPRVQQRRFDASLKTLYHVSERTISAVSTVVVEVKSGRVGEVRLSLPEAMSEPRVTAPSLNKVEPVGDARDGRRTWRVRLTQQLEGVIQLHVESEMLMPRGLGTLRLPDLRVVDAEVEQGEVAVSAQAAIEVKARDHKELRPLDIAELPASISQRASAQLLFGFRYAQSPWQLGLEIKRHKTVQTLDAMVRRATVRSHVLDTGHVISEAELEVANSSRQFLRVSLAKGVSVLAVSADGTPIKAVEDASGAVKIPLKSGQVQVLRLRYQHAQDELGVVGWEELHLPAVDVRMEQVFWTLRTPGNRTLFGLSSSLQDSTHGGITQRPGKASAFTLPMPVPRNPVTHHFFRPVLDPLESAQSLSFGHVAAPARGFDLTLFLFVIALSLAGVWLRFRHDGHTAIRPMVVGITVTAIMKGALFGWALEELLLLAISVAVLGWAARIRSPVATATVDGGAA